MQDELIFNFMKKTIFEEVIPTLTLPKQDLIDFANAVITRFNNPYVKHALLSISLNSVSKWRARCMPSFLGYIEKEGKLIALVYPDFENAGKENITQKNIEIQMEENRIALNKELPAYSQISQINIHYEEFEKTPKRSIKRYLYQ